MQKKFFTFFIDISTYNTISHCGKNLATSIPAYFLGFSHQFTNTTLIHQKKQVRTIQQKFYQTSFLRVKQFITKRSSYLETIVQLRERFKYK